ncbi:MAG: dihydroorotate dehydrogenase electron transfer subunit [Dehalobacterium sp.]
MKCQVTGKILINRPVSPIHRQMILNLPDLAAVAKAGQFLHIRCGEKTESMIRRPISINSADREKGEIGLLYEVKGRGTQWLAEQKEGNLIDVMGPLGNGFMLKQSYRQILLVGGGIGVAPLFFLAQEARAQGKIVNLLLGARSKELVMLEKEFRRIGVEVQVATDDGSYGFSGFVTQLIPEMLNKTCIDHVYACGPKNMLLHVAKLAEKHSVPCSVSLEERMACGVSACRGCVVGVKNSRGELSYKNVCSDGPVFEAQEVIF